MNREGVSSRKKKEPSVQESEEDISSLGRWTREEHNKFVDGLRKYGKNWKLIEDYVNTRSGSQIRSHAQKFFSRLERQCNVTKSDVFKYLDKLSNDLLEFNSENEMLRKRKIWEIIKSSNVDDFDCNAVEERLEKFTKVMEAAMSGSLAITNHELRDSQYMVWREVIKGVVDLSRDFINELEKDNVPSFKSNCYKKFVTGINVRLLGTESEPGGGGSTSQDHPHMHTLPPPLPTFGRMHSNSEDNICVDFNKVNKPRLKDFIQMNQTNPPITADGAGFVRTRLPSFKGHDESEETLEKIKQFKADNQLSSDGKRNRTASLDL